VELNDLRAMRYAVVDVETTGSSTHRGDRIFEIAIVHVENGSARTALELLINPQRRIMPFVSRLTGVRWDMVHEAPTFGDVADMVHAAVNGRVFVAHNVKFDWGFVTQELRRATGHGLRGKRLCTVRFARKLLSHLQRRNLDSLAWHYEVAFQGRRHRAGPDARATADVLLRLLADGRRQDIDTWEQLQALLRTPSPPPVRSYLPQPVRDEAMA
jgi:DNA polymerase III epsilon subunit family exonuclease